MNAAKIKIYEQWQLLRLYGVLNSPHLVLIYPIYTIQLKSMCQPYIFDNSDSFNKGESGSLKITTLKINKGLIYNIGTLKVIYDSLRCIYYEEGYWGLYRGFIPMIIHSYLTRKLHEKLVKLHKKYNNSKILSRKIYLKSGSKYIAEFITYPLLLLSSQQAIFDVKRYNHGSNERDMINESVIGLHSLIRLSLNSEGFASMWRGISSYILTKILEDLIKNYMYSYLVTKVHCTNKVGGKCLLIKPNNKKHLRLGVSNFAASILSPLVLVSTVKRCQSNKHNGLCRGNVGIKEILGNVNWGIYFGQIIVNTVVIALNLLDYEKDLI
ncbi:mitochondrial FAD carrier protein [Cryptosporidium felis]|nr:mitochondrial FAD carrier protein [Cryptosporidium felis]